MSHQSFSGSRVERWIYVACALCGGATSLMYVALKSRSGDTVDWLAVRYGAPVYGAFVFWFLLVLSGRAGRSPQLSGLDLVAVFLAASRVLIAVVPFSGHVLFLAYSLGSTRNRVYRVAAGLALLDATYIKLVRYGDSATWALGGTAAAVLLWLRRKQEARLRTLSSEA